MGVGDDTGVTGTGRRDLPFFVGLDVGLELLLPFPLPSGSKTSVSVLAARRAIAGASTAAPVPEAEPESRAGGRDDPCGYLIERLSGRILTKGEKD